MKPFTTVSSMGTSNKLSEVENGGADYGPDTAGTVTCGLAEAFKDGGNVLLTGGRYILKGRLDVKSGVNLFGGQNSVVVNETDDLFEPCITFEPYTYCQFLAVDANKKSGVQLGKPGQNNSISVGTLKVFNAGDIFHSKHGSQTSVTVRGYNLRFESLDIEGGNSGLLMDNCSDIRGNDVLVVNSATGISISAAEHVSISNITVDSCRYVGLQVDSSHDVSLRGTVWNNASVYPDSKVEQAVIVGKYSAQNGNIAVDLDLKIIGTGGTALEMSNCKYCRIDANIINSELNTETQRIKTGIKFGGNVDFNTIRAKFADIEEKVSGKANGSNTVILENG